jgi:endoglucanase
LLVQRDHPGTAGLVAETGHGLGWLDKVWDGRTRTLYAQVGTGVGIAVGQRYFLSDHDTWRLPQADDASAKPDDPTYYQRSRPVFRAADPGQPLSPNLAGRVAAAFALAAQVEATGDPDRARAHLNAAAQIFALADTRPTGELVTSQPRDFYPEDTWHDDLALAATELALAGMALHDPRAVGWERQATRWAKAVIDDEYTDTLSVYDLSALADAELGRLLTSAPVTGAAIPVAALYRDLGARVAAGAAASAHDPFGAAAGSGSSDYAVQEFSYAAIADLYRTATANTRYAAFATTQRGVALGANGWGTSLVVGAGTTYPQCPHDPIADLSPGRPEPVGAVVNGPNRASRVRQVIAGTRPSPCTHPANFAQFDRHDSAYTDDAGDSANTEPAIDFTATALFAFALARDQP